LPQIAIVQSVSQTAALSSKGHGFGFEANWNIFWDYSERGGRAGTALRNRRACGLHRTLTHSTAGAEARGVTIARMNPNPVTPADTAQSRSV